MRRATSRPRSFLVLFVFLVGMLAPLVPLQVAPVLAQPLGPCVVTMASDPDQGDPVEGQLRYAIEESSCTIITFDIPTHSPVITIGAFKTHFTIARNLTIQGPNRFDGSAITINGGGVDGSRVFRVTSGATKAVISRLSITGGSALNGGGIWNQGTLHVVDSRIYGNNAGTHGGGIENDFGTLSVTGSEISGNTATSTGGGIASRSGPVTVVNSTVTRNTAAFGGGIDVAGSMTIITGTIISSTIYANFAPTGASIHTSLANVTVTGSIVANDSASIVCNSPLISGGYNLTFGTTCFEPDATNIVVPFFLGLLLGDGPALDGLGFHGGPTQTYLPNRNPANPGPTASPAVDAIPANICTTAGWPTTDQRGVSRPQRGACDIGAVERSTWDDGWVVTSIQDPTHAGQVTLRDAIASAPIDAIITFSIPGPGPHVVQLEDGPLVIDKNLTIQGPNLNDAPVEVRGKQGASGFRVFEIVANTTVTLSALTIAGGQSDFGGGIYTAGTLYLRDSTVSGNVVTLDGLALGGGLYVDGQGEAHVSGSTFHANRAKWSLLSPQCSCLAEQLAITMGY